MDQQARTTVSRAAIVMVVMMFFGYSVNFMDRQIVSILIEPIKSDLGLKDGQIGLLTGMSFALFYAVMGLPIAALSDRFSRKRIIVCVMLLWSAMTIAFGLAHTYPEMFVARMLVGVGEAGFAPAAFSMVADYFPRERRGTATAVGAMGAMAGSGLGLMVGGLVAQHYGWRTAMQVAGAPGLVLALLFGLLVQEPERGLSGGLNAAALQAPFGKLFSNRPYLLVVGSGMANMFVSFACLQWFPPFLMRTYHMTHGEVGGIFGSIVGGVGALSLLCSGYATDVLSRRDIRWGAWIPAVGALLAAPLLAAAFYVSGRAATLTLFSIGYFFVMFFSAPNTAMIQSLVPLNLRARATALFLLMTSLVGFGIGPWIAGSLSESYRGTFGPDSLRYALMTLTPVMWLSPVLLMFTARHLKRLERTGTTHG